MGFSGMLAVLLVVAILAVLAFKNFSSNKSADNYPQISIQAVHSAILNKIEDIKELSTVKEDFQSTIYFSDTKKILGHDVPFSERKLTLSYTGTLVCGSDLEQIKMSDSFF